MSPEADLADALSGFRRCLNGHWIAKPKINLPGTNPSSWCSIDGDFVIFAPKFVTNAQIMAQGTRLKAYSDAKRKRARMSQASAAGTLDAWERLGLIPKASEAALARQLREIDRTVTAVKSEGERNIDELQRVLRKGMGVGAADDPNLHPVR